MKATTRLLKASILARSVPSTLTTRLECVLGRKLHTSQPSHIKRRPLPTTTSMKYTIPSDPYKLAEKFQQTVKQGKLEDAVAIVMQTKTRDQSAVVWNLVIDEYAKCGRLSRALRAYTEMRRRGFKPTQTTFTALLKACAHSDSEKSIEIAEELYEKLSDFNIEPSAINTSTLFSVYRRHNDLPRMMNRFNDLPSEGKGAPMLSTYTMVIAALRNELLVQIRNKKIEDKDYSDGKAFNKYRMAIADRGSQKTFETIMDVWSVFVDDIRHRYRDLPSDTGVLLIDAKFVNSILKACHAIYQENRSLGRRGLKVIEEVYGLYEKPKTDSASADKKSKEPIAVLVRDSTSRMKHSEPVIDEETVELTLDLCLRDKNYMKGIRFWNSVSKSFGKEIRMFKGNGYEQSLNTLKKNLGNSSSSKQK